MLPCSTHTRSAREAAKGKQTGRTQEIQRLIGRSLYGPSPTSKALGERQITSTATSCRPMAAPAAPRSPVPGSPSRRLRNTGQPAKSLKTRCGARRRHFGRPLPGRPGARPRLPEDSGCDTDMNVATGSGGLVEIQGTAGRRTLHPGADEYPPPTLPKLVSAASSPPRRRPWRHEQAGSRLQQQKKVAELQALLAPLGIAVVTQGELGFRGRGTPLHLRRECLAKAATRPGDGAASPWPTIRDSASMPWAARRGDFGALRRRAEVGCPQ